MSNYRQFRAAFNVLERLDNQYMSIEALEDGLTVSFSQNTIYYSIDLTKTWTALSPDTATPTINAGDRIYFKAEGLTPNSSYGIGTFTINKKCKACGNVMSLTDGDLKSDLFDGLFENCTTLIEISSSFLPATVLTNSCYYLMFSGCTSLVNTPELPATTLANYCYYGMFQNCTSLVNVQSILPATTLADYCYDSMFKGCTSLVNTPELPAITLARYGYSNMFTNCTSLVQAPELPATVVPSNCYLGMFLECTSLVTAPELPATTLKSACYLYMFDHCALVSAPELPATTLNDNCYLGMFRNCTLLRNAPTLLPATAATYSCYLGMFQGCTSLVQAPEILATTLNNSCFDSMFYDCTSLVNAPSILPAITAKYCCYLKMFYNCTSLVNAPELPAKTLDTSCYEYMFYNCKSLVQAPVLPAMTLVQRGYYYMFYGCSKLNFICAMFTTKPSTSYTGYWVSGVASSGVFVMNNLATWSNSGINGVPNNWTIKKDTDFAGLTTCTELIIDKAYDVIGNDTIATVKYTATGTGVDYRGNAVEGTHTITGTAYSDAFAQNTSSESITKTISITLYGMTVSATITQGPWRDPDTTFVYIDALEDGLIIGYTNPLKYYIRGESLWRILEDGKTVPINTGERIYVLGQWLDGYTGFTDGVGTFSFSKQCKVGGNINSLVNANNTKIEDYLFKYLFENCSKLIEVEYDFLNYSELAISCYSYMFRGCKSLTTAPQLPATTLAQQCYANMFKGCTSLTTAPELPATTLANDCYLNMFQGCTSLVNVPSILPAITLTHSSSCYLGMFQDCTSLTTTPALPATTLIDSCYYSMFQGCTSLTTAPDLPATTLASNCYYNMFYNCSKLTKVPESLPATTLANYCYNQMFRGCTSLTTPPALPATTLADYCYASMFRECSNLNTSINLPALETKQFCYANMFRDCTSLTAFSKLPATTLSPSCYLLMFYNCSNLTEAPELPATTLASQCYYLMFSNTGLTKAPDLPATTLVSKCYFEMFRNCSNLKQIYANFLTVPSVSYTLDWVTNVSPVGTFIKNYLAKWNVVGYYGIPFGWDVLLNIEILSCSDLQITADNVSHSSTTTTIHYSAVCEVKTYAQEIETITMTGTAVSDSFDKNMDPVDKEVVITFTYHGVTAQTTIIQGAWKASSYELNLNNQWLLSSVPNPDTSLYEGVYESFSNKGVNNSAAAAYITIEGYSNFKFYIRSYGESNYDYVMVSLLDLTITYNTSYNSTSLVKAHTRGKPTSGTLLSNYTLVEFTEIGEGPHVITVLYRKDSSGNTGDDKGYLLIPKDQ